MNTRTRILRNTLFSSVGMYTEYVLGMLTSILIARHLAPAGYGTYSLVIWLVGMGVAATNSGTASAAIKFVAEMRGGGRDEQIRPLLAYLRRAQRLFLLFVLLAGSAVFVVSGGKLAPGVNHPMLLAFLAIAVVLRSSYMLNICIIKGFEDFKATAMVALVSTPLNLGMVLAAIWLDAGVEWLLAVFVASSTIFYAMSQLQASRLIPKPTEAVALPDVLVARIKRHMWLMALIVTIGFFVASEVEVLFLNLYAGTGEAGQFKVAHQLAMGAALLVPGVFGAILPPMMAHALSQGQGIAERRFVASTAYLAMLALPLIAFGAAFAESIIRFLYGEAYVAAAPVFAICLAGTALATMTYGANSLLVSADRQGGVLARVVLSGAIKVTLDVVLIRYYGLHGAAIAYFCGALASTAITMALAIKVGGVRMGWARLMRIAAAAALAGVAVWPLRGQLPALAEVAVGGLLLAVVYAPLTLLFGCWSRSDIEYLQSLLQRRAADRPNLGTRLLTWAHRRAPGDIA